MNDLNMLLSCFRTKTSVGEGEVAWGWFCLNSISLMALFMHHPQAGKQGRKRNKEEKRRRRRRSGWLEIMEMMPLTATAAAESRDPYITLVATFAGLRGREAKDEGSGRTFKVVWCQSQKIQARKFPLAKMTLRSGGRASEETCKYRGTSFHRSFLALKPEISPKEKRQLKPPLQEGEFPERNKAVFLGASMRRTTRCKGASIYDVRNG